jgi:hypothetical protein
MLVHKFSMLYIFCSIDQSGEATSTKRKAEEVTGEQG